MANPYKQGLSAKRSSGAVSNNNGGGTNGAQSNNVQRVRSQTVVSQSPSRSSSIRDGRSSKNRSPETSEVPNGNFYARGSSPARRLSTASGRLARTSSISPSRAPPTMTNPEGRGRKLPATPIRYVIVYKMCRTFFAFVVFCYVLLTQAESQEI